MTHQPAPDIIHKLVETFEQNLDSYHSTRKNETELRREFLDKFFSALGWDVANEKGYDEAGKEVIHEFSVEVAGQGKKADYAFRVGRGDKFDFLVEAKKPSVKVENNQEAAFQLRRYGWSAKLPINILTDFEHFAVYDCRSKPNINDKASVGRIMLVHYKEYVERWHEIAAIFSPEAIRKGSFAKYAEGTKGKKGTADVDDAFLEEIERWRDLLARNIALRNPNIDIAGLNYAVQMTIDRIVFLRICEEREIEPENQLFDIANKNGVYKELCELFKRADIKYNSGLFHFKGEKGQASHPDDLTLALEMDDKVLKDIISNLYYPKSPYAFLYIPSDILGQVYERFLGKVIRLTAGHQAKVEEKPEVRKAGGVYYTPTYIVEYIVNNTVGKLVENKTPREVAALKIVDPACGSGTFLLGAYQFLLDWHLNWYLNNDPEKWVKQKAITPTLTSPKFDWGSSNLGEVAPPQAGRRGSFRLTTAKKKEILLNNIYGVDIDAQAVEVSKLSLLLKVLENASGQLTLGMERVLPDLGNNIKCGNSLIGWDYFEGQMFPDQEEQARVNPFDWKSEFPQVFNPLPASPKFQEREFGGGEKLHRTVSPKSDVLQSDLGEVAEGRRGFDAVIGNPPYLRIQGLQESYGNQVEYFAKRYKSAVKRFDFYLLFCEQGFRLLKNGGKLGFICPHKFLNSDFGSGLRSFLIENGALETFISFGNNLIFEQASVYTGLLFLQKSFSNTFGYFEFENIPNSEIPEVLGNISSDKYTNYEIKDFSAEAWVLTKKNAPSILQSLSRQTKTLGDVCDEILVGVQSGIDNVHLMRFEKKSSDNSLFLFSERANEVVEIETGLVKPIMRGEDVKRYESPQNTYFCIYPYKLVDGKTKILEEKELKDLFPKGYAYLKKYQRELTEIRERQKTNPKYWYSCHRSRDMNIFESERIITPEISLGCNMTIAPEGLYHNTKVYSIVLSKNHLEHQKYWLGLLNSKLLWWYISNTGYVLRGGYFVFKTNYLSPFPIRIIDFSNPAEKAQHDQMVSLVEQMLALHKQQTGPAAPQEKERLQRQIGATDRAIDKLVYALYGLSAEEIQIIESAS